MVGTNISACAFSGRRFPLAILTGMTLACSCATHKGPPAGGGQMEELPVYECRQVKTKIVIDGHFDEPAWQGGELIDRFYQIETFTEADTRTEARIVWDPDNLYVAIRADDRDLCALGKERDSDRLFRADLLEVFLQPGEDVPIRYEINVDPKGVVYDAFYPYGNTSATRFAAWDGTFEYAVALNGTLNDWQDEDQGWQLEIRIPFSDLPSLPGNLPQPGTTWRFHIARYNFSVYVRGAEISSCVPFELTFHEIEKYPYLRFVAE